MLNTSIFDSISPIHVRNLRLLSALLLTVLATSSAFAQPTGCSAAWVSKYPQARIENAVAYDSTRNSLLTFGGETLGISNETWEWRNSLWSRRATTGPSARNEARMVYDELRNQVVLFGGYDYSTGVKGDTWIWDGSSWSKREPTSSPPPRSQHHMAYDRSRGMVVLFGGYTSSGSTNDLWEWDGTSWTLRTPPVSPPARRFAAFSYDVARGVTVLFGGSGDASWHLDTWEWNGTTWAQRTPAVSPQTDARLSMAYDEARGVHTLIVPVYDSYWAKWSVDTWEWDGTNWLKRSPLTHPGVLDWTNAVYSPQLQRVLIHGGYDLVTGEKLGEIWSYNGSSNNWERIDAGSPSTRAYSALAYDSVRGRTVLFGGGRPGYYTFTTLGDTWEEDGSRWIRQNPALSPSKRYGHGMTFDSDRGVVVLFGGHTETGVMSNQTWEYNGTTWTERTPAEPSASPQGRYDHALTYDPVRHVTVLFGGSSQTELLDDTWEWNGTTWVSLNPPARPTPRISPRMAFHSGIGRAVLFGDGTGYPADTNIWEWTGSNWVSHPTGDPNPGNRQGHGVIYEPNLKRLIVVGGVIASGEDTTWGSNMSSWSDLQLGGLPRRYHLGMVFDSARNQSLLYAGYGLNGSSGGVVSETWALKATDSDGDGSLDCNDGCPNDPFKTSAGVCGCGVPDTDSDGDGASQCIDSCDNDPLKSSPGVCGCGVADIDSDGDGALDCVEQCPNDPLKSSPGTCGCGVADTDSDNDGVADCIDQCMGDPGKISGGSCGCGVADTDTDSDGTPDCIDQCGSDANKTNPGSCGCGVWETDTDGDTSADCVDLCPADKLKTLPGRCGCGIQDIDSNSNGHLDCDENLLTARVPSKPKLKQIKNSVRVTMSPYPGAQYLISYRIGNLKRAKTAISKKTSFDIKRLNSRQRLRVAYKIFLPGSPKVFSKISKESSILLK